VFHAADSQLARSGRTELGEIGTRREHVGATQLSRTKICVLNLRDFRGTGAEVQ